MLVASKWIDKAAGTLTLERQIQTRLFQMFKMTSILFTWPHRITWLHAMQVLISSGLLLAAFFTKSGSARNGLAIDTRSAAPSLSTLHYAECEMSSD